MNVIIANFGNDSIALIAWALQQSLSPLCVLSVDTAWAAPSWEERVMKVDAYLKQHGVSHRRLQSPYGFQRLVEERNNFPSMKFHWCASFLKGVPMLDYLDELDPDLNAVVLLAKRREQAKALENLAEFELESHTYGGRKVWYPLYQHSLEERNRLIFQTGFDIIATRSLECDPCIYNQRRDFKRLAPERRQQLARLEQNLRRPMFGVSIDALDPESFTDDDVSGNDKRIYYQGCGSEFGCGD